MLINLNYAERQEIYSGLLENYPVRIVPFLCESFLKETLLKAESILKCEIATALKVKIKYSQELLERDRLFDVYKIIRVEDDMKPADKLFTGCKGKIMQIDYCKLRLAKLVALCSDFCWT